MYVLRFLATILDFGIHIETIKVVYIGDGVTFKNTPSQRVGGVSKGMRPEGLSRLI